MIMPVMGGRECLRALQTIDPGVRVVLSTGFSQDGEVQQLLSEGLAGFIQKPYRIEQLAQAVRDGHERKRTVLSLVLTGFGRA
jgi:two-component system, cell cycle sensor histidine kinase and response regulator CckA